MTWSHWEDRVEEVLTPIILEMQKNKEFSNDYENVIGELIGYLFLIVFAFGWMDTLWIFGVENSKEYTWWYLIQQMGSILDNILKIIYAIFIMKRKKYKDGSVYTK